MRWAILLAALLTSAAHGANDLLILRDGAELTVLGAKDDWLEVRDAEKRIGWIRRDELIVLGAPRV